MEETRIQGGTTGLQNFSNVGFNEWALLVDHVKYDGQSAYDKSQKNVMVHTKLALIDSGNSSIQLPMAEFRII